MTGGFKWKVLHIWSGIGLPLQLTMVLYTNIKYPIKNKKGIYCHRLRDSLEGINEQTYRHSFRNNLWEVEHVFPLKWTNNFLLLAQHRWITESLCEQFPTVLVYPGPQPQWSEKNGQLIKNFRKSMISLTHFLGACWFSQHWKTHRKNRECIHLYKYMYSIYGICIYAGNGPWNETK